MRGMKRLYLMRSGKAVLGSCRFHCGFQSATQEVVYVSPFNWWDQLELTCRNPLNFHKGSLTIPDRVRHKYNAALLAESGV